MSNSWSKEDRYHYNKSEVMQELENRVMETLHRLDILNKKAMDQSEMAATKQQAEETQAAVQGLKDEMNNPAIDGVTEDDEVAGESLNAYEESQNKDAVINDLRDMVQAALSESNIKLAYKIERTIDEILEQEVLCEL